MKSDEVRDNITCSQLPAEGVGQTEIPSEEKPCAWRSLLQPQQSCHKQRHWKASAWGNLITCDHPSVLQRDKRWKSGSPGNLGIRLKRSSALCSVLPNLGRLKMPESRTAVLLQAMMSEIITDSSALHQFRTKWHRLELLIKNCLIVLNYVGHVSH